MFEVFMKRIINILRTLLPVKHMFEGDFGVLKYRDVCFVSTLMWYRNNAVEIELLCMKNEYVAWMSLCIIL